MLLISFFYLFIHSFFCLSFFPSYTGKGDDWGSEIRGGVGRGVMSQVGQFCFAGLWHDDNWENISNSLHVSISTATNITLS